MCIRGPDLPILSAKAVNQVSGSHLEIEVVDGTEAVHIDGCVRCVLKRFFDPKRDLWHRDMRRVPCGQSGRRPFPLTRPCR